MVLDYEQEHGSQWAAIQSIASKIGCMSKTLRNWVRHARHCRRSETLPSCWQSAPTRQDRSGSRSGATGCKIHSQPHTRAFGVGLLALQRVAIFWRREGPVRTLRCLQMSLYGGELARPAPGLSSHLQRRHQLARSAIIPSPAMPPRSSTPFSCSAGSWCRFLKIGAPHLCATGRNTQLKGKPSQPVEGPKQSASPSIVLREMR